MIVESVLLVGGFIATFAIGAPVAAALARPHRWRRGIVTPEGGNRERVLFTAGFEPLDLGPDPTQWPSQHPWTVSRLGALDWPSRSWDDEHFGAHWRAGHEEVEDQGFHAMAKRDPRAGGEQWHETEAKRVAREQARRERDAPRQAPAKRHKQSRARPQAPQEPPRELAHQRRQTPQPRPAPPQSQQPQAPSKAELERMVAEIGLAGTVQQIMARTGWDFRQAAHYLAKMRQ